MESSELVCPYHLSESSSMPMSSPGDAAAVGVRTTATRSTARRKGRFTD
jgi:hypothetical protein